MKLGRVQRKEKRSRGGSSDWLAWLGLSQARWLVRVGAPQAGRLAREGGLGPNGEKGRGKRLGLPPNRDRGRGKSGFGPRFEGVLAQFEIILLLFLFLF